MAPNTPRDNRSGVGPGRGKQRPRAASRTRVSKKTAAVPQANTTKSRPTQAQQKVVQALNTAKKVQSKWGISLTKRALALTVVLALLTLSYASSLRIYFTQKSEIGRREKEIAERKLKVAELSDKVNRWNDPNYVRAQARARLGWVAPGETGYVVLGADGKPINGSGQITESRALEQTNNMAWYQRLYDSFLTADQPIQPSTPPGQKPEPSTPSSTPEVSGPKPAPSVTKR